MASLNPGARRACDRCSTAAATLRQRRHRVRGNRIEQVAEHRADLHAGRVIDAGGDVVMRG